MNADTFSVLIRNNTENTVHIFRNFRFGHFNEMNYFNSCHVTRTNAEKFALRRFKKNTNPAGSKN